jgi:hypothetical protein
MASGTLLALSANRRTFKVAQLRRGEKYMAKKAASTSAKKAGTSKTSSDTKSTAKAAKPSKK